MPGRWQVTGQRNVGRIDGLLGGGGAAGRRGRCGGSECLRDSRDHELGRRRRVLVGGRVDGHAEPVAHVDVVLALRRQGAHPASAAQGGGDRRGLVGTRSNTMRKTRTGVLERARGGAGGGARAAEDARGRRGRPKRPGASAWDGRSGAAASGALRRWQRCACDRASTGSIGRVGRGLLLSRMETHAPPSTRAGSP